MLTPTTAGLCGPGVDVQEDDVDVVNPATILDFTGNGVTVTDGGGGKAIINIPGGGTPGSVGIQCYPYVADGTETAAGFNINLQTPRADAFYQAFVFPGSMAAIVSLATPPANYTNTLFKCIPGDGLTAGDTLLVLIVPTT